MLVVTPTKTGRVQYAVVYLGMCMSILPVGSGMSMRLGVLVKRGLCSEEQPQAGYCLVEVGLQE